MVRTEALLKTATYTCALAGIGAALPHLGRFYIAGFAALALLALLRDAGKLHIPLPRWFLNATSLIALAPSALRMTPENIVGPVLEGLSLLLAIKLLEEKKSRDYMQVYLICMFLLIGSTLISLNISFLFFFLALVFLTTFCLVILAFFAQDPEILLSRNALTRLVFQVLLICAVSVPACSLFFIILPRADYPLFSFLGRVGAAKSGFTDSVSLGDVTEIQEDSAVVLRAEMSKIPEMDLYWRGIELDRFDGVSWQKSLAQSRETRERVSIPDAAHQTIYLEPHGNRYLFALDRPAAIIPEGVPRWRWRKGNQWHEDIEKRIRYKAVSVTSGFSPDPEADPRKYLGLPEDFSPQIRELTREIAGRGGDPVTELLLFFQLGDYEYSLDGLPQSDKPLEDFILTQKRGNCEYFASALGAMLRSAGIPARLVAGYRGGYYNPAGKYYLVLQKNAHVWVEAYRSGGWVRLDPTPLFLQPPSAAYRENIFLQVRLLLDTFDYYWGKFVLSYDLSRQLALWGKVKSAVTRPTFDTAQAKAWMRSVAPFAAGAVLIAAFALLVRRGRGRPEQRLVSQFLRRMKKRGYHRAPGEGLEEFSSRVREPELKARAVEFVQGFQDVFYRGRQFSSEETKRLKSCIRCL